MTAPVKAGPFGAFERTLAWRYLRARREHGGASLISVISFVGIALAVAALIVTMSLMSGFRATLLDKLLGGQGHMLVTVVDRPQDEALQLADQLGGLDDVLSATPVIESFALLSHAGRQTGALVRGVRPEDLSIYPFLGDGLKRAIENGYGEGRFGGDVVLLGAGLAQQIGAYEGSKVVFITSASKATVFGASPNRKAYTVGGVFRTGSVELDRGYAFMPLEQAQVFFDSRDRVQALDLRLRDPFAVDDARVAIQAATPQPLFITDWQQIRQGYLNALQVESSVMRIIFLILITITALNIITGVVMLVKNKTRDVAILRTIGAGRNSVMRVFIMVGASLGITGALIGLGIGVAIVLNISSVEWFLNTVTGAQVFNPEVYGLDGLPAILNWGEALFTALWAIGMSILVTIFPAWRAARMDPVEALRFE
ncbi:MAG: lipoprotein-releasing ABC transporter permease subunit [Pseudomonadota bacterium]